MVKDMLISGVICEFNPLHNGHKYLLDTIKKETGGYTVCVMSGNFVQRGECAIIDKYTRTKMALANGADLVIELPSPFAVSTAEKFAFGGVSLLHALGCCDRIYFGSESNDGNELYELAKFLLSEEFSAEVSREIKYGDNFASAREKVVEKKLGAEFSQLLRNPNDILGTEYVKAIINCGADMEAHTIKRLGAAHDGAAVGNNASAKAIREMMNSAEDYSELIPESCAAMIKESIKSCAAPASLKYAERSIIADLRRANQSELTSTPDVNEGLENKIISAAMESVCLEELYMNIKSKRYSHARIRRIILNRYLRITNGYDHIPYIRVLGTNDKGLEIIKNKSNTLPFVMNFSDVQRLNEYSQKLYALEAACDDLYDLMQPKPSAGGKYYRTPLIKK